MSINTQIIADLICQIEQSSYSLLGSVCQSDGTATLPNNPNGCKVGRLDYSFNELVQLAQTSLLCELVDGDPSGSSEEIIGLLSELVKCCGNNNEVLVKLVELFDSCCATNNNNMEVVISLLEKILDTLSTTQEPQIEGLGLTVLCNAENPLKEFYIIWSIYDEETEEYKWFYRVNGQGDPIEGQPPNAIPCDNQTVAQTCYVVVDGDGNTTYYTQVVVLTSTGSVSSRFWLSEDGVVVPAPTNAITCAEYETSQQPQVETNGFSILCDIESPKLFYLVYQVYDEVTKRSVIYHYQNGQGDPIEGLPPTAGNCNLGICCVDRCIYSPETGETYTWISLVNSISNQVFTNVFIDASGAIVPFNLDQKWFPCDMIASFTPQYSGDVCYKLASQTDLFPQGKAKVFTRFSPDGSLLNTTYYDSVTMQELIFGDIDVIPCLNDGIVTFTCDN